MLLNSRKPLHKENLSAKVEAFQLWCMQGSLSLSEAHLFIILDYLLNFKTLDLLFSSIKVHLAAITAFNHSVKGVLIFAHSTIAKFLKGLITSFLI